MKIAPPRTRVNKATGINKAIVRQDHRKADLVGVLLIAIGIVSFLALLISNRGIVGDFAQQCLRAVAGKAAFAFPIIFIFLGYLSLAGKRDFGLGRIVIGLTIGFIAIATTLARSINGDYFDPATISSTGGYIGAITGWLFSTLLGGAQFVGIALLYMVAMILCIDVPLRHLLDRRKTQVNEEPDISRIPGKAPRPTRDELRKQMGFDDLEEDEQIAPTPVTRELKTKPLIKWGSEEKVKPKEGTELSTSISVPKEGYQLPPLSLLAEPAPKTQRSKQEMQRNIETLEGTLEQFGIDANVVEVANGPTITRYEIQLGPGIRVTRITALADNIAMDLAASHVRVEAPIPGKAAIGVEVPNSVSTMVSLRELCETKEFLDAPSRLTIALGKDVSGVNKYADLTKMPHLLIGGATNSGKSIGLSTIITSLLMRNTPKDLRLVMIDPKRVELTLFDRIPHLMCPVIKDVKETPGVLRAVWREMDRRYDIFSQASVRNIDGWNAKASFNERMPYIVVIIDELADLMIQAAAEVETSICRLAQLARATGIHLVIATQRPSVDVITGTIKANIASRIAFTVSSQIDSRTILDAKGAESLIGRGDMLFLPIDASKPLRVQGCYVSEKEIDEVCTFWRNQEQPAYTLEPVEIESEGKKGRSSDDDNEMDALWEEAVRWVAERGQASTSMLQRKFSIGFQRASRLLDSMEERQIVGPRDGPRPREVLVSLMELESLFSGEVSAPPGWDE